MLNNLPPTDYATVENFCRELAFAMRRILGEETKPPVNLPQPVPPEELNGADEAVDDKDEEVDRTDGKLDGAEFDSGDDEKHGTEQ